jgi:hypothetical protein
MWPSTLTALLLCLPLTLAHAADPAQATIDNSFKQFSGINSINQAAGQHHQQANTRQLTIGKLPDTSLTIRQTQHANGVASQGVNAQVRIQGHSFSQSTGITGLNQSAGIANQNINALRISVGATPESLDDLALSQTAANLTPLNDTGTAGGQRLVETSDRSFAGSRGVVQLNQSAGVGNRTANNLSIRVTE